MTAQRSGLPALSGPYLDVPDDIAGHFRHHAMLIADGELPKPSHVLLIERHAADRFVIRALGVGAPEPQWFETFGELRQALSTDY